MKKLLQRNKQKRLIYNHLKQILQNAMKPPFALELEREIKEKALTKQGLEIGGCQEKLYRYWVHLSDYYVIGKAQISLEFLKQYSNIFACLTKGESITIYFNQETSSFHVQRNGTLKDNSHAMSPHLMETLQSLENQLDSTQTIQRKK